MQPNNDPIIVASDGYFSTGSFSGRPNKVIPSSGVQGEGFLPNTGVPASVINYIFNNHGSWIDYLHDETIRIDDTVNILRSDVDSQVVGQINNYSTPGSYTFNKHPRAQFMYITIIGGGGGGSGGRGAVGGGGGGSGMIWSGMIPASFLDSSESVIVGAAGTAGFGYDATDPFNPALPLLGGDGGSSRIGTKIRASGGKGGGKGTSADLWGQGGDGWSSGGEGRGQNFAGLNGGFLGTNGGYGSSAGQGLSVYTNGLFAGFGANLGGAGGAAASGTNTGGGGGGAAGHFGTQTAANGEDVLGGSDGGKGGTGYGAGGGGGGGRLVSPDPAIDDAGNGGDGVGGYVSIVTFFEFA